MGAEHVRHLGRYFAWCKEEGEAEGMSWEPGYSGPFLDKMGGTGIENRFDYSKMDYSVMQMFLAEVRNKDNSLPSDTHLRKFVDAVKYGSKESHRPLPTISCHR